MAALLFNLPFDCTHSFSKSKHVLTFYLILLQVEGDLGTSAKRLSIISGDSKGATSLGFPDILLIIIMFRGNNNFLGHQVSRVETHTELANHAHVSTCCKGLHKLLGSRTRNSTQIVYKIYKDQSNYKRMSICMQINTAAQYN